MDTEKVKSIISSVHKDLSSGAVHDDCVDKVYDELRSARFQVEKEKTLKYTDGDEGIPDLTIVNGGNIIGIVEIKCKNHLDQGDNEQAEKFKNAVGGQVPVVVANMQPGKPIVNFKIL